MRDIKTKPCPFCRGTGWHYGHDYGAYIICDHCGACGPYERGQDESKALRAWGKRAGGGNLKRLVAALDKKAKTEADCALKLDGVSAEFYHGKAAGLYEAIDEIKKGI